MRILITGGGGFVGSHLVDHFLAAGHEVRVLDNFATGRRENLSHAAEHVEVVEGDIQSYERVHNAVRGCDAVLHQAALPSVPRSLQDPLTTNASNIVGTLNVLLASRDSDVSRVVYASSSSVYGASPALPKTETLTPTPISPYAVTKLAGEGYCRSFAEVYGLETVSLRYFNVFGPRQDPLSQYAAVVPNFITAFLADQPPTIFGDGEQTRDFTYVDNVVRANAAALSAGGVAGQVFNIACAEQVSLNRLVGELRSLTGRDVEAVHAAARPGEVRHSLADIATARAELGYEPSTDLRAGLELTLRSYVRGGVAVGS